MDDLGAHRLAVAERRSDVHGLDAAWQVKPMTALPQGFSDQLGQSLKPRKVSGADVVRLEFAGDALASPAPAGVASHVLDDLAKVALDRIGALCGIVLLSPIMAMVAVLIWLRDPGPVLFGHTRIGRGGQKFRCLKFRTMVRNGDEVLAAHLQADPDAALEWEATRKLKSDPRVTPIGRVLRKTSLDELPQLFNVLIGEMSLVGPRPIVDAEAHHYGAAMQDYTAVRPGVTGLWQVRGRSDTSYPERVKLDQEYVRQRSFGMDVKILFATVVVVVKGRGSY